MKFYEHLNKNVLNKKQKNSIKKKEKKNHNINWILIS